ncbi:MAG TPA: serine--tRNA ligase [Candidatus Polarisedimenticolia bacterium]|jgi:seryl-tRNA synthetase|nr:serine--tRNA ligase [Candidatus Polarisedimenticolia bacterium]
MLEMAWVRDHLDVLGKALRDRGAGIDPAEFKRLDEKRRASLREVEQLKASRNQVSERIAALKKDRKDATSLIEEMRAVGDRIKELDAAVAESEAALEAWLLAVPNVPHASVPVGHSSAENVEVRRWGRPPAFDFPPLAHWDLGTALGILDFERAAKIAGARFAVYMGAGARLERALINFMLDLHTREHGYTEVLPPFMVNTAAMVGTGNLPKFADDLFRVEKAGYWLIPTAEVPLTNLHREEFLDGARLPISYTAYTPCFRSEAGSYGKDVKGLIRQHQFNKVELVKLTRPEDSMEALERLTKDAETVLQRLELPYRVVALCTGDMGFPSMKTYDIEVWLPSFDAYREISSCSNCGDYQARRAGIRFRRAQGGKSEYAHSLNGSGLAVGRTVVALLENGQRKDGSIAIPKALQPYFGADEIRPG